VHSYLYIHSNRFIKQEAEEKSSEIAVSAEEEFNITKLQLLEGEKVKVRRDFDRKEKAHAVKKKVEYSKHLNENRIRVLQAREDAVQALLRDAQASLLSLSLNTEEYKRLVLGLILEGMHKLDEPSMLVRCREIDAALVESLLSQVGDAYLAAYGKPAPSVRLDASNPLPPPPRNIEDQIDAERMCCSGGVIVTSSDGTIECSNTLDDRLRIAYASNLPAIRACFST
jgi:V-type H+-transporting ATPase subunit E